MGKKWTEPLLITAFLCAIVISHNFVGCTSETNQPVKLANFSSWMKELSGNTNRPEAYQAAIEAFIPHAIAFAKKNPQQVSRYFSGVFPSLAQSDVGTALEIEALASSAMQAEMQRLRQESSVENLLKKEKEIVNIRFKLDEQVKKNQELESELIGLRKLEQKTKNKVPVLLYNTWELTVAVFRLRLKDHEAKDEMEYLISPQRKQEVLIHPGEYRVSFLYRDKSLYAETDVTVPVEVKGDEYYAIIKTP